MGRPRRAPPHPPLRAAAFAKRTALFAAALVAHVLLLLLAAPGEGAETLDRRAPLTHLASIRSVNCPVPCSCSATTWNCDGAGLTSIPTGYPRTLMNLNLHNNSIREIPASTFQDLPLLRIIDLRNNLLETLVFRVFSDLPVLHTVYLANNSISTIEVGAFRSLPRLRVIRMDFNQMHVLRVNTFRNLPYLREIRLNDNFDLHTVEPGAFNSLPELRKIEMYRTKLNTTILGTWDPGAGVAVRTFAPDCPKLDRIELGTVKMTAIYPNTFQSNDFLETVRRIGQTYKVYSTNIGECDMLNGASVIEDSFGSTLCMVAAAATEQDSPSKQEKSHLPSFQQQHGGSRL